MLHPAALLADVSAWAGNTAAHRSGLKLPLLFAAFLFLGYVMLHALTRLNPSSISSEVTVAHGRFR